MRYEDWPLKLVSGCVVLSMALMGCSLVFTFPSKRHEKAAKGVLKVGLKEHKLIEALGPPHAIVDKDQPEKFKKYYPPYPSRKITKHALVYCWDIICLYVFIDSTGAVEYWEFART